MNYCYILVPTEEDFVALNNDIRFIIELYEKEG